MEVRNSIANLRMFLFCHPLRGMRLPLSVVNESNSISTYAIVGLCQRLLSEGALTEDLKLIIKLQSSTQPFIPSISILQRKAPFVIESKEDTGCSELIRKGVSYLLPHLSLRSFIRLFCKENSLLEESSRKWIHNLKNFK